MVTREPQQFSVLYTRQKTKKAKTWQDGVLKIVSGTKALLCDGELKTLDSLFVRSEQVAPGEELESERYLITVEEHLTLKHNPETTSNIKSDELKGSGIQLGKRKRGGFQPPPLHCKELTNTASEERKANKHREGNAASRPRLGIRNRYPSKKDFFSVYSSNNQSENDVHQSLPQTVPYENAPQSYLSYRNKEILSSTTWEHRDQRVPFNSAEGNSGTGKENHFPDTQASSLFSRSCVVASNDFPGSGVHIQLRDRGLHSKTTSMRCHNFGDRINDLPERSAQTWPDDFQLPFRSSSFHCRNAGDSSNGLPKGNGKSGHLRLDTSWLPSRSSSLHYRNVVNIGNDPPEETDNGAQTQLDSSQFSFRSSSIHSHDVADIDFISQEFKGVGAQNYSDNTPAPSKTSSSQPGRDVGGGSGSAVGKRNSAQILALFSCTKKALVESVSKKYHAEQKESYQEENPKESSNAPGKNVVNVCAQTSSITMGEPSSSDLMTFNPNEMGMAQGLCDSFDFSPDSFVASSNEERESKSHQQGSQDFLYDTQGSSAIALTADKPPVEFGNDTRKSLSQQSAVKGDTQLEGGSQADSESLSPLLKHLCNMENMITIGSHPTCANLSNACQDPRELDTDGNGHENFSSNMCLRQQASVTSLNGNTMTGGDRSQNSSISDTFEGDLNHFPVLVSDKVFLDKNYMRDKTAKYDFSIARQTLSSHPGSLFEYTALSNQANTSCPTRSRDSMVCEEEYDPCGRWKFSTEGTFMDEPDGSVIQTNISPEFYPSDAHNRGNEWSVSTLMATKVIFNDSRTVKTDDGHSWKGSVVSDTVKREYPSVPMISLRRQEMLTASNGRSEAKSIDVHQGSSESFAADDKAWANCNNADFVQIAPHFSTSKSIVLPLTEGCVRNTQTTELKILNDRAEFMQRVPKMVKHRVPIITGPSEDSDSQGTTNPLIGKDSDLQPKLYRADACKLQSTALPAETFQDITVARQCSGSGSSSVLGTWGENSLLSRSSLQVGLRRVGKGKTRDHPEGKNFPPWSRKQFHCRSGGYHPPPTPDFMVNSTVGDHSMAGELCFPSAEKCESSVTPTRKITVPVTFDSVMQYRQVLKAALREHLNIVLFELARTYHSALNKVDISGFSTHEQGKCPNKDGPCCSHGQARLRAVKKEGVNKGRLFYACPATGQGQCKFFKWADEYQANKNVSVTAGQNSTNKILITSSENLMAFFRSHNVAFYCECHLVRKQSDRGASKSGSVKAKWGRKNFREREEIVKKGLYLELPRKEDSSAYSKDDIWIISKNFSFAKTSTFIASSAYYGPSSSGELEIVPISGYSPSNWQSGEIVHALRACNAGTELTCISNIEDHVKIQNLPILSHLLNGERQRGRRLRVSTFDPPMIRGSSNQLNLPWELVQSLTEEMIARYNLNKDQATALHSVARMFHAPTGDSSSASPVCLIHGVFGAGKSFLLAVVILFLVEVFNANDSINQQSDCQSPWKILVSSTTNVAVDRILLGLLHLGFEEFVRVGSVRKIAKPLLPYSVHSTGSDSQELRELQALLKNELTHSERNQVRKSIERHKLGENKKKLSQVRVVGVTCVACVFPCLNKMKFPMLLLDECSQMTEPSSLLPMARFECQKLVLVGDPKQLSPTIQGSEPDHEVGLEQTLFDRLIKMGFEPTLLRTQYRCHPTISALSNRLFYDMKLIDGVTADDRSPHVDIVPTLCFYDVAKGKEKCGSDGSYYNEEEAKFVVLLIECLLESGMEPAQIGVITLYKSQLHIIANNLTAIRARSHSELKTIKISTVDAFQGGEKDLIILSCVRTDHVGFIDCNRRTNVALTRAKRHLLIIGNLKMLSCNAVWGKVIEQCGNSPDGLCSASDFIQKYRRNKEGIDCREEDFRAQGKTPVSKDDEESKRDEDKLVQGALPSVLSKSRAISTSSSKAATTEASDGLRASDTCITTIPIMDDTKGAIHSPSPYSNTNSAMQENSDDGLPTFDLVFSLGI